MLPVGFYLNKNFHIKSSYCCLNYLYSYSFNDSFLKVFTHSNKGECSLSITPFDTSAGKRRRAVLGCDQMMSHNHANRNCEFDKKPGKS